MSQTFLLVNLYEAAWIVYSVGQILERVITTGLRDIGLNGEKRHDFADLVQGASFFIILLFFICVSQLRGQHVCVHYWLHILPRGLM